VKGIPEIGDVMTHQHVPSSTGQVPRWRTVNIAPGERLGRMLVGLAAIVGGALLLAVVGSVLAVVLEVLLILAGVDLLVTGAFGHCPLYQKLGFVPPSLRSPR